MQTPKPSFLETSLELIWMYVSGLCLVEMLNFSPDSVSWRIRLNSPLVYPPTSVHVFLLFTEEQPHIMMLPPPCFTVGVVFLSQCI